jgi:pimeloyl-ACP methyl ester carboxylesterase
MRVNPAPVEGQPHVTVDDVEARSLYRKTKYVVETADRWSLVVTRYRPVPQPFPQPLFGEPLLLVHGFSQNRHAWTSGEFVKNLLFFGIDIHILELRGHGKSSVELQKERADKFGRPPPADLDYDWDIDSYFLYDLPAAVAAVKRVTRRKRIFYCGHSMGGILAYGYAGIHDDFEGLITIGAPADLGRGFLLLRAAALSIPLLTYGVDLAYGSVNLRRKARAAGSTLVDRALQAVKREAEAHQRARKGQAAELKFRYVPVDRWLRTVEKALARTQTMNPIVGKVAARMNRLANLDRVGGDDIRWLLREGGEREPRKVIEQFARWIRRGELCCYRTGYDFKRGFSKIRIPMAIIFGDMDPLASVESTRGVYRAAQSEYLLWRPVKGNSHIELTMGHDIRQICYDIKNLMEYARSHRTRRPSLPRREPA